MISIPPDTQIKTTIQTGTVYWLNLINDGYDDASTHRHVVLNKTPTTDLLIIMCWITSETETHKGVMQNSNFANRFVRLTKDDYDVLIRHSVIDCHHYVARSLDEIIAKNRQGNLQPQKQMPLEITELIRNKLLDSPTLEKRIEKILLGIN